MGSPTIFSGRYTKLLTNKGILNSDGSLNQNDGPINYVKYAEFEQNVTTGWSLGTTGTLTNAIPTGTPTFGSGASGNLSIATSNISPIRDNFSLRYVSSAATTAGNMLATDALTIDAADQAKVLTYKFYYSVVSGATTANFSGTSSNSFGVAIWDVTNSAWIGVAGNFSMTQNSGVGIASGTFQTNSNTSQIRLVIYNANATSGAITLAFDDFFVGPQTAPIGPVVTDWVSYTPTVTYFSGGATNVTHTGRWRRVGDQIEIDVTSSFSNTSAAFIRPFYSLPSGLSFDTSKMPSSIETKILGYGEASDAGNNAYPLVVGYRSSTQFFAFAQNASTSYSSFQDITNTIPFTFNSGDEIQVRMTAPISGWSSQVQLSNDTDTRVVAATAFLPSTTGSFNAESQIVGFSTINDTHAAFNGSTYTVPVSGYYNVSFTYFTNVYTGTTAPAIRINGSPAAYGNDAPVTAANARRNITILQLLKAGDTITFYVFTNATVAIQGGSTNTYLSVQRLSGPSVVAASESVAMRFNDSSGQAISANTLVKFGTKDFDSHNAYSSSTGLFTVPVSGKYSIKAGLQMSASVTLSTAQGFYMSVVKNGSTYGQLGQVIGSGVAHTHFICGSDDIICNAGDTIALYAGASVNINLNTTATANHLSIVRVGN